MDLQSAYRIRCRVRSVITLLIAERFLLLGGFIYKKITVTLAPIEADDGEQFILDNQ